MIPAISMDDPEMQNMLSDPDPLVSKLVKARLLVKSKAQLLSRINYLSGMANLTGGTLPVFLKYHHAQTGRFAGGNGLNLQNLPVPGRSPVQILNDTAWKMANRVNKINEMINLYYTTSPNCERNSLKPLEYNVSEFMEDKKLTLYIRIADERSIEFRLGVRNEFPDNETERNDNMIIRLKE